MRDRDPSTLRDRDFEGGVSHGEAIDDDWLRRCGTHANARSDGGRQDAVRWRVRHPDRHASHGDEIVVRVMTRRLGARMRESLRQHLHPAQTWNLRPLRRDRHPRHWSARGCWAYRNISEPLLDVDDRDAGATSRRGVSDDDDGLPLLARLAGRDGIMT